LETLLHVLHLYGSAGIAAFGWAVCRLLDWPAAPWVPMWFCAALLIYNADRLRVDPADAVNIPHRASAAARWSGLSRFVGAFAAVGVIAWPLGHRDWLSLGLVLGGGIVCLNYSVPLLGFRWKDVPLLKTFFAPTIVAASILGLPWLHLGAAAGLTAVILTAFRTWTFLLFNMLLCDLRDLAGDRASGVRTLPVALGERRTHWLLIALLVIIEALALLMIAQAAPAFQQTWRLIAILGPIYLGALLVAVRRPRSERFYEWAVEGMLFLPPLAVLVTAGP
jgi:4-hydroxybenzoate polyprenyltransferase